MGFMLALLVFIGVRLFQVQVLDYQEYSTYAQARLKGKVIPARRGKILLKDSRNGYFELVNNVTLNLLFADPMLIENPLEAAEKLAPLLFRSVRENSKSCGDHENCYLKSIESELLSERRIREQENLKKELLLNPDKKPPKEVSLSEEILLKEYVQELYDKLSQKEKVFSLLALNISKDAIKNVQDARLKGIYTGKNYVWANPKEVTNPQDYADILSPLLQKPIDNLVFALSERPNRYIRIHNKIDYHIAEEIRALNIKGIGFEQEYWRNYSEQEGVTFLSQTIGFLDHEGNGVYGIEKEWDDLIRGKSGIISGQVDLLGRTLTARESFIEEAVDGADLVLSIDHTVQNTVEELLRRRIVDSNARSGQVIVQDPRNGKIIALANYPGFNPNRFGDVYKKKEIALSDVERSSLVPVPGEDDSHFWLYYNPGFKIDIFSEEGKYYAYENRLGVGVYRNSAVSDIYEPGSVFKALVMASAIDAKEIKPGDVYQDNGPLEVDCHDVNGKEVCDFTIKNSNNNYYGTVSITQILDRSLNTGMAFIAKKMGQSLLYDYLSKFGFGEKTFIELPDESKGQFTHYRRWVSESDLITKAFGQGIAVTPIQMVNAFSAVVNGGILFQASILDSIRYADGRTETIEPSMIRRVITPETSKLMKAILVSGVERGVAAPAAVPGYRIGGKTGTSQIATKGLYEKGQGSTYATFAGFGPFEDPRFVVLVKVDRPRATEWGASNAAPLFKEIMSFLLNHYQIPPDKNE